jgi:ppGpp synthetase/RelA/SpoT-type nucleotidyltranferase
VNRLGDRLRKSKPLTADIETLDTFRRSFDAAQQTVVRKLRELGLEPSVRIKTTISIVDKLKRESIRLSRLQDIAGCRVVVADIAEQDRVVGLILGAFSEASLIDRRQKHSHGYRAVHVVIEIGARFVEVQIRTELQHLWAVFSEVCADAWDQSIKYGGGSPEIQENLRLKSEIVALIESGKQKLLGELKMRNQEQQPMKLIPLNQVAESFTTEDLAPKFVETMKLMDDFVDLIRREQEMKGRFTRDILRLIQKGEIHDFPN